MERKQFFNMLENLSVTPKICDAYLKSQEEFFTPVLKHYNVDISDLRIELRKELCNAGLTVREMSLAVHFLIENCTIREEECEETLHAEVKRCILYSAIYFTNVLPGIESGEGVPGVIPPTKVTSTHECNKEETAAISSDADGEDVNKSGLSSNDSTIAPIPFIGESQAMTNMFDC